MSFYKSAIITSNVIGVWDMYLIWRQRASYQNRALPPEFKDTYTTEEFNQAQEYGEERTSFSLVEHVKDMVLSNISLVCKIPAKIYYFVSGRTGVNVGSFKHNLLFSVATDIISTLLGLPFAYYNTFVVEKNHGFNKTTVKEFVKDEIKSFLLRVLLLYPIQTGLIQYVVYRFGERFPAYFFAGTSAFLLAFMFIYPTFIQPLFNKYTPLDENSELYVKIKKLAESVQFPLTKVFVCDGSRRSAHSNAYMYGFWKNKRIVLYDTIIDQMKDDDEQIIAVLCHELGHWKKSHIAIGMCLTLGQLLAISYGAKAVIFNPALYEQFGFHEVNAVIGFEIFSQVFLQPMSTVMGYAFSFVSRQLEFQADRFSVSNGYGKAMYKALLTTAKENKSGLQPDWLFSALNYSHPPLLERLKAIEAEDKKTQ